MRPLFFICNDLDNNALPLYLVRPFSRVDYILGKFSVLAILLSGVTWVPALLLYGLQVYYAPEGWNDAHSFIPRACILLK